MERKKLTHELNTGGDRGYLRIATEEAFATQEQPAGRVGVPHGVMTELPSADRIGERRDGPGRVAV